jgi:hypothetical protein
MNTTIDEEEVGLCSDPSCSWPSHIGLSLANGIFGKVSSMTLRGSWQAEIDFGKKDNLCILFWNSANANVLGNSSFASWETSVLKHRWDIVRPEDQECFLQSFVSLYQNSLCHLVCRPKAPPVLRIPHAHQSDYAWDGPHRHSSY